MSSSRRSWNGNGRSSIGLRITWGPRSVRPARSRSVSNSSGIVGDEVAARPVAVEHGAELGEHVGVAGGRRADVPFESGDLRRMCEVRRADVRGREPGAAMEHPRLGVQPGRARGRTRCARRRRGRRADRAHGAPSSRCRWWSGLATSGLPRNAGASASRSGAMPLRRMKAITTSIASADSISERNWLHNVGSPGAFVSNVVSSNGMSGTPIPAGVPSGLRRSTAWRTAAGSIGIALRSISTSSPSRSSSARATRRPICTRSASPTSSSARSTCRLTCHAIRSDASALFSGRSSTGIRSASSSSCALNPSVMSNS